MFRNICGSPCGRHVPAQRGRRTWWRCARQRIKGLSSLVRVGNAQWPSTPPFLPIARPLCAHAINYALQRLNYAPVMKGPGPEKYFLDVVSAQQKFLCFIFRKTNKFFLRRTYYSYNMKCLLALSISLRPLAFHRKGHICGLSIGGVL